jgi:hypothetical protein
MPLDEASSEDAFSFDDVEVQAQHFSAAASGLVFLGAINPPPPPPERSGGTAPARQRDAAHDEAEFQVGTLPVALDQLRREFGDLDDASVSDLAVAMVSGLPLLALCARALARGAPL